MTLTSSVIRLHGPGDVRVEQEELDLARLGERQIAAKTLFSAVSTGTELAAYRGDPPLRPTPSPYPRLVGYCNVAEVVSVGRHATRFRVGDLILTGQSHRSVFVCEEESVHLKLPAGADPRLTSTAYLFHLGYASLLSAGVQAGQRVSVIGLGTLGLGTVACARMMGVEVKAVSAQPASLELASRWGACPVPKAEAGNAADSDCVVLTSNLWEDWLLALKMARSGGFVAVLGFPGRGQPPPAFNPLDSQWFYDKRLTLKATGPTDSLEQLRRHLAFLVDEIAGGRLDAEKLVSKTINWQELPNLYAEMAANRGSVLTAVLKW
jgi:threonine dehydrogenase-like Zn-dependent dehydrogenase